MARPADEALRAFLEQTIAARSRFVHSPKGAVYSCLEQYLLDRGTFFAPSPLTPEERVLAVRAGIASGPHQFKECYRNAMMFCRSDQAGTLRYVEGIATMGLLPVAHAWVSLHGKVIDPTWRTDPFSEWPTRPTRSWAPKCHPLGELPDEFAYLGVEMPCAWVFERSMRLGIYAQVLDDWKGGWPVLFGREPWKTGELPEAKRRRS